MDDIPLPPSEEPSYSPSQVTMSSPESSKNSLPVEKVPVLGKEKAKKRLLAFGKGISFGLKPRSDPLANKGNRNEDEESQSSSSSNPAPPTKKLNIDAIMEEEKELAASRPMLSYLPLRHNNTLAPPNVMPAVPQLIVPVLPPNAVLPPPPASVKKVSTPPSTKRVESDKKHSSRRRRRRSHDKFGDVSDIPSSWKSFKTMGLLVSDPEFPKFKRQLDKEHDRLEALEARKRTHLNIVKSGDVFLWKEYVKDPHASECELAIRGLSLKSVSNYSKEGITDLLWNLDSDYHSKEFPRDVNKFTTKGRHAVSYCFNPRFYPHTYESRRDISSSTEEGTRLALVLEALFKKDSAEDITPSSKFTSGSFVSKEIPSLMVGQHRSWYKRPDNFLSDKETLFPEVVKARQEEGFEPSVSRSWSVQMAAASTPLKEEQSVPEPVLHEEDKEEDKVEELIKPKKRIRQKSDNEAEDEEPVPFKKVKKASKKKKSKGKSAKKTTESDSDQELLKKKRKKKKKKKKLESDGDQKPEDEETRKAKKKKKKSLKKHSKKSSKKNKKQSKESPEPKKPEISSLDKPPPAEVDEEDSAPPKGGINVKDPRTRSLFAVAGYGPNEEQRSSKRKSAVVHGGPRTPSPSSKSSRGPRTPSPSSKSGWRPPSPPRPGSSPRKYRRSRSRSYERCSSHSPPSHHRRRRSRHSSPPPHYHLERSVADSTISDADLPCNLRQIFSFEEFMSSNSPKRPSLDERLEKELGINVREAPPAADFSVPPPGFPFPPPSFAHPPPPIHHHMILPVLPQPRAIKDPPEEGRLVRVGNMLQIVPENTTSSVVVPPPQSTIDKVASAAAAVNAALSVPSNNTAVTLMRKMEEMKRARDRERQARKEEEEKEKEQRAQEHQEEEEKSSSPEAKKEEAVVKEPETVAAVVVEEDEAKILQEAISSVPELDEEETFVPKAKVSKKTERIHYISLKPFSKKERRRQQKAAVDELEEEEEEWIPASPVPLPDASTCKPILLQLGFSGKEKKVLRYADGILPGQGSPDISDIHDSSLSESQTSSSATPKKRKKIRLKIISVKDTAEQSSSPPPPPCGSPSLHHYSTWVSRQAPAAAAAVTTS